MRQLFVATGALVARSKKQNDQQAQAQHAELSAHTTRLPLLHHGCRLTS
jgi:hypothetical protein